MSLQRIDHGGEGLGGERLGRSVGHGERVRRRFDWLIGWSVADRPLAIGEIKVGDVVVCRQGVEIDDAFDTGAEEAIGSRRIFTASFCSS